MGLPLYMKKNSIAMVCGHGTWSGSV